MYTCPVCGYDKLNYPYTEDGTICPSCGTEFGYDDFLNSHAELRQHWIAQGAQWWSPNRPRPPYWSPIEQLRNISYEVTDSDRAAIAQRIEISFSKLEISTNNSIVSEPRAHNSNILAISGVDVFRHVASLFTNNETTQSHLVRT